VLLDEDMNIVRAGAPPTEVRFQGTFEVGRPAGLPEGTALDFLSAINIGPLELPPGKGYSWVVNVDGLELRRVRFRTRAK
jgi:hypothetical protein